jgi:hypothetical protein
MALQKPRSWTDIEQDEAYKALAPDRKLKLLGHWTDQVRSYGTATGALSRDYNVTALEDFRTQKEQELTSAATPPPEKPFFRLGDVGSALAGIPEDLYYGVPVAMRRLSEGLNRPDQYSEETKQAFAAERARMEQEQKEQQERELRGETSAVGDALRQASDSAAFSIANMAVAIPAAAATTAAVSAAFPPAAPVTAPLTLAASAGAAMLTSAPVAYRIAGNQFLDDAFAELAKKKGTPLTETEKQEAYDELLPIAQNTALWEAGPEAVGNAVTLGVGKFVFGFGKDAAVGLASKAIGKAGQTTSKEYAINAAAGALAKTGVKAPTAEMIEATAAKALADAGKSGIRRAVEKGAAVLGDTAVETTTEAITQTQQGYDQARMQQYAQTGSTEGAVNEYEGLAGFGKAYKEVFGPTVATLGLFGATAGAVKAASSVLPGNNQQKKEQVISDIVAGASAMTNNLNQTGSPETAKVMGDMAAKQAQRILSDQQNQEDTDDETTREILDDMEAKAAAEKPPVTATTTTDPAASVEDRIKTAMDELTEAGKKFDRGEITSEQLGAAAVKLNELRTEKRSVARGEGDNVLQKYVDQTKVNSNDILDLLSEYSGADAQTLADVPNPEAAVAWLQRNNIGVPGQPWRGRQLTPFEDQGAGTPLFDQAPKEPAAPPVAETTPPPAPKTLDQFTDEELDQEDTILQRRAENETDPVILEEVNAEIQKVTDERARRATPTSAPAPAPVTPAAVTPTPAPTTPPVAAPAPEPVVEDTPPPAPRTLDQFTEDELDEESTILERQAENEVDPVRIEEINTQIQAVAAERQRRTAPPVAEPPAKTAPMERPVAPSGRAIVASTLGVPENSLRDAQGWIVEEKPDTTLDENDKEVPTGKTFVSVKKFGARTGEENALQEQLRDAGYELRGGYRMANGDVGFGFVKEKQAAATAPAPTAPPVAAVTSAPASPAPAPSVSGVTNTQGTFTLSNEPLPPAPKLQQPMAPKPVVADSPDQGQLSLGSGTNRDVTITPPKPAEGAPAPGSLGAYRQELQDEARKARRLSPTRDLDKVTEELAGKPWLPARYRSEVMRRKYARQLLDEARTARSTELGVGTKTIVEGSQTETAIYDDSLSSGRVPSARTIFNRLSKEAGIGKKTGNAQKDAEREAKLTPIRQQAREVEAEANRLVAANLGIPNPESVVFAPDFSGKNTLPQRSATKGKVTKIENIFVNDPDITARQLDRGMDITIPKAQRNSVVEGITYDRKTGKVTAAVSGDTIVSKPDQLKVKRDTKRKKLDATFTVPEESSEKLGANGQPDSNGKTRFEWAMERARELTGETEKKWSATVTNIARAEITGWSANLGERVRSVALVIASESALKGKNITATDAIKQASKKFSERVRTRPDLATEYSLDQTVGESGATGYDVTPDGPQRGVGPQGARSDATKLLARMTNAEASRIMTDLSQKLDEGKSLTAVEKQSLSAAQEYTNLRDQLRFRGKLKNIPENELPELTYGELLNISGDDPQLQGRFADETMGAGAAQTSAPNIDNLPDDSYLSADSAVNPEEEEKIQVTEEEIAQAKALVDSVWKSMPMIGRIIETLYRGARAFVTANRRDAVYVNFANIARAIQGLDEDAARTFIKRLLNHEGRHLALLRNMTLEELKDIGNGMTQAQKLAAGMSYYANYKYTSEEQRVADMKKFMDDPTTMAMEYLTMLSERMQAGESVQDLDLKNFPKTTLQKIIAALRAILTQFQTRMLMRSEYNAALAVGVERLEKGIRDLENEANMAERIEEANAADENGDRFMSRVQPVATFEFKTRKALEELIENRKRGSFKGITTAPDGTVPWQNLEAKIRKSTSKAEAEMILPILETLVIDGRIGAVEANNFVAQLAEENITATFLPVAGGANLSDLARERASIVHDLDTNHPGWRDLNPPDRNDPRFRSLWDRLGEIDDTDPLTQADVDQKNLSATEAFQQVNPKPLKEMSGAGDVLVQVPLRDGKKKRLSDAEDVKIKLSGGGVVFRESSHYPYQPNVLGFGRQYIETLPNGEKAVFAFEIQSDWAKRKRQVANLVEEGAKAIRSAKEAASYDREWYLREVLGYDVYSERRIGDRPYRDPAYRESSEMFEDIEVYEFRLSPNGSKKLIHGVDKNDAIRNWEIKTRNDSDFRDHPLVDVHESLVLKSLIQRALGMGITKFVLPDAETAMMTEGHDMMAAARMENLAGRVVKNPGADGVDFRLTGQVYTGASENGELLVMALLGVPEGPVSLFNYDVENDRNEVAIDYTLLTGKTDWGGDQGADVLDVFMDDNGLPALPRGEALRKQLSWDIPQERGMRAAYDVQEGRNHAMLRKWTKDAGKRVDFGEHQNVKTSLENPVTKALAAGGSPVFKNPDGSPKTNITGVVYDISSLADNPAMSTIFQSRADDYTPQIPERTATENEVATIQQKNRDAAKAYLDTLPPGAYDVVDENGDPVGSIEVRMQERTGTARKEGVSPTLTKIRPEGPQDLFDFMGAREVRGYEPQTRALVRSVSFVDLDGMPQPTSRALDALVPNPKGKDWSVRSVVPQQRFESRADDLGVDDDGFLRPMQDARGRIVYRVKINGIPFETTAPDTETAVRNVAARMFDDAKVVRFEGGRYTSVGGLVAAMTKNAKVWWGKNWAARYARPAVRKAPDRTPILPATKSEQAELPLFFASMANPAMRVRVGQVNSEGRPKGGFWDRLKLMVRGRYSETKKRTGGISGSGAATPLERDAMIAQQARIKGTIVKSESMVKNYRRERNKHKDFTDEQINAALGTTENPYTDAQVKELNKIKDAKAKDAKREEFRKANAATDRLVRQQALSQLPGFNPKYDGETEFHTGLAKAVEDMRIAIDEMSQALMDGDYIPAPLKPRVEQNKNVYVHRSYTIFDNPEWKRFMLEPQTDEHRRIQSGAVRLFQKYAVAEIAQELRAEAEKANAPMSQRDAIRLASRERERIATRAGNMLVDYLSIADDKSNNFFVTGELPGQRKLDIIKVRGQIPKEVRELWGEIQKADDNFVKTMSKMAGYMSATDTARELVRIGLEQKYMWKKGVSEGERPAGFHLIYRKGDASPLSVSPMDDVYAPAEVGEFMRSFRDHKTMYGWARQLAFMTAGTMAMKTIGNFPQGYVRNFFGNPFIMVNGGYINPGHPVEMFKAAKKAFKLALTSSGLRNNEAVVKSVSELTSAGLIGEGVDSGLMREMTDTGLGDLTWDKLYEAGAYETAMKRAARQATGATRGTFEFFARIYQGVDDFWKVFAYEMEKFYQRRTHTDWTEAQISKEAIDRVRNKVPTYSLSPELTRNIRNIPFIAPFITWTSETIRTSANNLAIAAEDIRVGKETKNPEMVKNGYRAIRGFAFALGAFPTLAMISKAMFGYDDEDEDAYREGLPEWEQNASLVFLGKAADGTGSHFNASFLDPYQSRMEGPTAFMRAMRNGDAFTDALVKGGMETLRPLLSEQLLFGAITSILRNRTAQGKPIYNEQDTAFNKTRDTMGYLALAAGPGTIVGAGRRLYLASQGTVLPTGQTYDVGNELLGMFGGQKVSSIDFRTTLNRAKNKYVSSKAEATQLFSQVFSSQGTVDLEDIGPAFENAVRAHREIQEEMIRKFDNSLLMGVPRKDAIQILRGSMSEQTISRDDLRAILSGKPRRWTPSEVSLDSAKEGKIPDGRARLKALRDYMRSVKGAGN